MDLILLSQIGISHGDLIPIVRANDGKDFMPSLTTMIEISQDRHHSWI